MKSADKQIALNGGLEIDVLFEAVNGMLPASERVKVRQVPIRDYNEGFKLVDDEPGLVSFLAGKPKDWALSLSPGSYEEILAKGREVNKVGFFPYCQRRTEREQTRTLQVLQNIPPQALEAVIALGRKSTSPPLPPGWQPPQG